MTAIITPFRNGSVDENALRKIIGWQISNGTDVLVPCGTTGEGATLSHEEHDRVIRITVEEAAGRVPVLAGAGSNSTTTAVKLGKQAKNAGAQGMLQVTPYYNKPTQEGLYQHFKTIAQMVDMPMMLYNVPGRTAVNMAPETTIRLSSIDSIVGIKEASGNIEQIKQIISGTDKNFAVISGDDAMNFDVYAAGGKGCISVAGNVVPDYVSKVWDLFVQGKTDEAKKLQMNLEPINKAMFFETNPIPAKTSLALMGLCAEEFRLPMTPMGEENKQRLIAVLKEYKII